MMKIRKTQLLLIFILFLGSGCARKEPTPKGTLPTHLQPTEITFQTRPASELLNASKVLSYPDDFSFTPTFLGNDRFVYGYSMDETSHTMALLALNLDTNDFSIIKSVHGPIVFGVYYADDDYVVFHEYHYEKQQSSYFLWKKKENHLVTILDVSNVPPLHYTEVSRWKNLFVLVASDAAGTYPILGYDVDTHTSTVIEERNSGYPVVIDQTLYYLLLDNEEQKTHVMSYDLISHQKKELSHTTGIDEFYTGLFSDGNQLMTVKHSEKGMAFYEGFDHTSTLLFHTEHAETISSHKGFLTFLGANHTSPDGRLEYAVYDLRNRIHYEYADNVLYLSDVGIFWVEYLHTGEKQTKGTLFSKHQSRMRFLEFPK